MTLKIIRRLRVPRVARGYTDPRTGKKTADASYGWPFGTIDEPPKVPTKAILRRKR